MLRSKWNGKPQRPLSQNNPTLSKQMCFSTPRVAEGRGGSNIFY